MARRMARTWRQGCPPRSRRSPTSSVPPPTSRSAASRSAIREVPISGTPGIAARITATGPAIDDLETAKPDCPELIAASRSQHQSVRDPLEADFQRASADMADTAGLSSVSAEIAAALESRAVITRPFDGEGIRVTVGTPEEDDVFLTALDQVLAAAPVS